LVLLDLSAAFDTVDHEILLSILETRFAIQCTALDWLRSYLTGRTQVFVYADKQTVSYPVLCSVPQGSVFGPLGFISYTEDIVNVTEQHKVSSHLYADDTQLYATTKPDDVSSVRRQLGACTADVAQWCASRRLQLNADKTEAIWIASKASLNKVKSQDCSLVMGAETVTPVDVVRNLGVYLDSELSMKQHVAKVASICFFHLRRLRQVRRRVGKDITIRLVLAVIMSRLDYCNSVLAGLPQSTLQPLQRVQNAAARLICDVPYHEHITAHLRELHWLPVRSRIEYKLCLTMYNVHNGRCPSYLSDMFQPADAPSRPLRLRSADSSSYVKPRLRTKFGERAFSHSGPAAWNQLPEHTRQLSSLSVFKRELKTILFSRSFE